MDKVIQYKQIVIEVITQVDTLGEKPDDLIKTQIITNIPIVTFSYSPMAG